MQTQAYKMKTGVDMWTRKGAPMRKILRIAACTALFCLWGAAIVEVVVPGAVTDTAQSIVTASRSGQSMFYDIPDDNVPLGATPSADGVDRNGQLRVAGVQMVNDQGNAFQVRGMSSHGLAWYSQYTGYASIRTTKAYGANLFRIAMYVDNDNGNYNLRPADQVKNRNAMYTAIDNTLALDMYAIADWHILKDGNPLSRVDHAMAFFGELSKNYAGEPGLIYEICNEPNGDTTWDDIYTYAEQVIPVIREHSPDALIIVGTPDFCTDLKSVAANPLPHDNVMYAYHYYPEHAKDSFRHSLALADAAGLPVFVSEWGIGNGKISDKEDIDYATVFLSYLNQNKISWANWSLSNKDESFSAIRANISKLSDWTYDDLTAGGQIVFEALGKGEV